MKRIAFLVFAMCLLSHVVLADVTISDDEISKLYDAGYEAYHAKDYVTALEYFFTYRLLSKELWNNDPEFGRKFDKTISSIEAIIQDALKAQGYEWEEKNSQMETGPQESSKGN
jgi:hypothetical protein